MTVDTNKIRMQIDSDDIADHRDLLANLKPILTELLDRLEAAEKERDSLRAMIMAALDVLEDVKGNINPELGYADELEGDVDRAIAAIAFPGAKRV